MALEWKATTFFDALHWRRPSLLSLKCPCSFKAPAIPDVQSEGSLGGEEADLEARKETVMASAWQVDLTSSPGWNVMARRSAGRGLQSLPEMIEASR